ncbi:Uma2 family endonuclease [Roseofilum reptotaenium CS-1145]|uniref:Putative restriction endonuclease domain-containing protein n=1 Tax=Roseofilum reptotaenium AO1-A TaxID=1925591 RepID=A0A1L9QVZ9_9CYAN|nr:Uma2 family endonuclease [Roseofilum reptotaenium]MDB9518041.1 Uma2 family endonuclease [Roseofilum reptotaenium CS-1145]OJJ26875.1 hypothetical protein BI308_04060 [Roseofilum reptotaenium AO1-A]
MTLAIQRFTLEEYLHYDDGTDTIYELVNGELVAMALGTGRHGEIADFINTEFRHEIARTGQDWVSRAMMLAVQSPRGDRFDTSRIPDVVVLPKEQWRNLQNREAIVLLNEPSPLLVVEVASPSTQTIDYRAKRTEYCVLDIPEYWIVDPLEEKVTIFTLSEGWYDEAVFTGGDRLISPTFPELNLTAHQVLQSD